MTISTGKISVIANRRIGTSLEGAHASGVSVVTVVDPWEFSEDGGTLTIDGDSYAFTGWDEDASTITLGTTTTAAYDDGMPVLVSPVASELVATVVLDDQGAAIEANVPHALRALLPEGIRADGAGETVSLFEESYGWEILDVVKETPSFDGAFIAPGSIDGVPDPTPPASSPAVRLRGAPGLIFVQWDAVLHAESYDLHVGAVGFTPDEVTFTTRFAEGVAGTAATCRTLGDGTPLDYDTDYDVIAIARKGDVYAAPGVAATGQMQRATSDDIAVGAVTAVNILGDAIDGMTITGSTVRTAATGLRAEMSPDGAVTIYRADGSTAVRLSGGGSIFSGQVDADRLRTNKADLGGVTTLSAGGETVISAGAVADPTIPLDHASVPLAKLDLVGGGNSRLSNAIWDATSSRWWRVVTSSTGTNRIVVRSWNASGVQQSDQIVDTIRDVPEGGSPHQCVAMNATHMFILFRAAQGSQDWTVERFPRTGSTISNSDARYNFPTVTGGYLHNPAIGLAGDGDLLIAYAVNGAQTINTLSFGDTQIHVGKYSHANVGGVLTLTLTKTIQLAQGASDLSSITMDATSSCFDMTPVAGETGLVVAGGGTNKGIGPFNNDFWIWNVANAGTAVNASWLVGAGAWYGGDRVKFSPAEIADKGLAWDGSYFWSVTAANTLHKFVNQGIFGNDLYHTYDLYNSTSGYATQMAPVYFQAGGSYYARHISRWSIPNLPVGVTQARIYVGSDATRLRLERQGGSTSYYTGTAGSPLLVEQSPTALPAGVSNAIYPPSATNTWPTSSPHNFHDSRGNSWTGNDLYLPTARQPLYSRSSAATQSLASSGVSGLVVTMGTLNYGTGTDAAFSYSSGTLTCIIAGTYMASGSVGFSNNSSGLRFTQIRLNGTAVRYSTAAGAGTMTVAVSEPIRIAAGDTIDLYALQTSGSTLNIGGTSTTGLALARISA